MLKKIMCALCLLSAGLNADLPTEFTVYERAFSWTSDFDIEAAAEKIGRVHRTFLSWTPEYAFYDMQNNLQSTAKMQWFSWGARFDIMDARGNVIGQVNEQLFKFFPSFEIVSANHQILAIANRNFWNTLYTISDPMTGMEMATLSRPFFSWRDVWTVKITNEPLFYSKKIDPSLFMTIMVFQTDLKKWKSRSLQGHQTERPKEQQKKMHRIACIIEKHAEELSTVEPQEADFVAVDALSEQVLGNVQSTAQDSVGITLEGVEALLPLLDTPELTSEEKSALLLMIKEKIDM